MYFVYIYWVHDTCMHTSANRDKTLLIHFTLPVTYEGFSIVLNKELLRCV